MLNEREGKMLQTVLAWGSISYALGFLTIIVHTSKLNIPIVKVLDPVYIWIGLPLTIVLILLYWLRHLLLTNINDLRNELLQITSKIQQAGKSPEQDKITIERKENIQTIVNSLLVILPPSFPLGKQNISKLYLDAIEELVKRGKEKPLDSTLRFAAILLRVITLLIRALNFFAIIILIFAPCFLYVEVSYPQIPQSFGGGKPQTIQIVMKTSDISWNSYSYLAIFPKTNTKELDIALTSKPVDLVFLSEDFLFVKTSYSVLSIKKENVQAIVWPEASSP